MSILGLDIFVVLFFTLILHSQGIKNNKCMSGMVTMGTRRGLVIIIISSSSSSNSSSSSSSISIITSRSSVGTC